MSKLSSNEKLLWALIENDEETVKKATADGADTKLLSPTGSSPLHVAALRDSAAIISFLIEHKAEVNQVDSKGFTPLMVAALNGKANAVSALLAKDADANVMRLDTGETALHLAMNGGSARVVKMLLEWGVDINTQTSKNKYTPLHFAAQFGNRDLAGVLLSDPLCEPETQDSQGRTADQLARDAGHHQLAEHLALCTATKTEADQELVAAVMKQEEKAVRTALVAGANANLSSRTGSRPLHAAALRGSATIIRTLLEHHAEVDEADCKGFTPLMVAALNGRTDAVKALLANRANVNLKRLDSGETALHMAMAGGSQGVVSALLQEGADINAQTTENKFTPLHFAAHLDAWSLAEVLRNHPHCDPDIKDSQQRTAVQLAEERGHQTKMSQEKPDGTIRKVQVITRRAVQPSEDVYNVTSFPRGRVLILNYQEFEISDYRRGADKDEESLNNLFTQMGYKVTLCSNASHKDTMKALGLFCAEEELGKVDCAIVCVLSHGKDTHTFITSDEKEVTVDEVYDLFTDKKCNKLWGKPKLFIFNFCRGKSIEAGCILDHWEGSVKEDAVPIKANQEVHDSFISQTKKIVLKERVSLYATVEGVKALRDVEKGSFFVQAIVKIFANQAHELDVDGLAKKVNKYMTDTLEGTTTSAESTTTKKFFLNPTQQ